MPWIAKVAMETCEEEGTIGEHVNEFCLHLGVSWSRKGTGVFLAGKLAYLGELTEISQRVKKWVWVYL